MLPLTLALPDKGARIAWLGFWRSLGEHAMAEKLIAELKKRASEGNGPQNVPIGT